MDTPALSPSLADLQSLLERAERDLVCADMIDSMTRRAAEMTRCQARVDELKTQIAAAEGWIPWAGGMCPVGPEDRLEFRLREGRQYQGIANRQNWHHALPGSPGLHRLDIVAYRKVQG